MVDIPAFFVGFSLLLKAGVLLWSRHLQVIDTQPSHSKPWSLDLERTRILMSADYSAHFEMESLDGRAEWAAIVPGSGVVHLGPHREPYTVSMMHQLRCLDIIRDDIVTRNGTGRESALANHCLNYMKQMVMCRRGLQLEPLVDTTTPSPVGLFGAYECKDWRLLYNEVEKNQAEYERWQAEASSDR